MISDHGDPVLVEDAILERANPNPLIEALEEYFWVPVGANDARLLKAFADGRKRIAAAAERKLLRAAGEPITLDASDFRL